MVGGAPVRIAMKESGDAKPALNPRQLEAAHHLNGPCVVWAGPGTGKTRILEERSAWLIEERAILPQTLLLLTFTRRAAGELRRRMRIRLAPEAAMAVRMSTLHSLALSLLVTEKRLRKEAVPEVIGNLEAFDYLKRALLECRLDPALYSPLTAWEVIAGWKAGQRQTVVSDPIVQRVLDCYQRILEAEGKWDLADLIAKATLSLGRSPAVAKALQVKYLMVDEWQDTSLAEYTFLRRLLRGNPNLMVVGAPAQSVYAWRGADSQEVEQHFQKDYPHARYLSLLQSYRSGNRIIRVAASVVPDSPEVWLHSTQPAGRVILLEARNDQAEAERIAAEIEALSQRHGLDWKQFAVLFRTWGQAPALEQAFIESRLPYVLYGDWLPFYERSEVRVMLAYLRLILAVRGDGGEDDQSLEGALDLVINTPPRGVGPASVKLVRGRHAEIGWAAFLGALINPLLAKPVRQALRELFALLEQLAEVSRRHTPDAVLAAVLRDTGWAQWLEEEFDGRHALRNLRRLLDEAQGYADLSDFVKATQAHMRSDLNGLGVALSTIHAAKGLEWPVVFVAGANEGLLPHVKALEMANDPPEERRLAHVAFSRARQLLVIAWFRERDRGRAKRQIQRPSRYLAEIPKEVVDEYVPGNTGAGLFDEVPERTESVPAQTFRAAQPAHPPGG